MKVRNALVSLAAMATLAAAAGCAAPEKESDTTTESGVDAATATSAEDFGGMDELVKAAQDEGELNVIAASPETEMAPAAIAASLLLGFIRVCPFPSEGDAADRRTGSVAAVTQDPGQWNAVHLGVTALTSRHGPLPRQWDGRLRPTS